MHEAPEVNSARVKETTACGVRVRERASSFAVSMSCKWHENLRILNFKRARKLGACSAATVLPVNLLANEQKYGKP